MIPKFRAWDKRSKEMLEGVLCAGCGVFLDVYGNGYPEYCKDCQEQIIEEAAE